MRIRNEDLEEIWAKSGKLGQNKRKKSVLKHKDTQKPKSRKNRIYFIKTYLDLYFQSNE